MFQEYFAARQSGSKKAVWLRNKIVEANRSLARKIAHRKAPSLPEPYDDIEQIATIGLIKAVERFDPNQSVAFSSFAVPYIEGELQHYFRDQWGNSPKVPRREIELSSRVKRVQNRLGIELDESAIARGLKVSPQKVRQSIEARTRKPVKSLDQEALQLGEESAIVEEDYSWIKSRVASLPEPYQSVIIDLQLRKQSPSQIARRYRVSASQVQLWVDEGLNKLKATERPS